MKYLIAEDELDLQSSIVTYLERDGHLCETASDLVRPWTKRQFMIMM